MKKIAVLQSNYIPWKGYFDIIHDVDEFIFYDEVQFTKNDWRNRNRILTNTGLQWLTIPTTGSITQTIDEVSTAGSQWQRKHYNTLLTYYSKAPFFSKYRAFLEDFYFEHEWTNLSQLNRYLIVHISQDFLGIKTKFSDSRNYYSAGSGHEKLLSLLKSAGAEYYVSGPAAKSYIQAEDYEKAGIELHWKDYSKYPEYPQLHKPFSHNVTILDLLFNTGDDAPNYIWS
ncbi:MAG: WbqC family protein [Anaerolineaceae bacterium]|nr:WbqC family protein [Anaerolineaceae bacterium]